MTRWIAVHPAAAVRPGGIAKRRLRFDLQARTSARQRGRGWFTALALGLLAGSASAQQVRAVLGVEAPQQSSFILHGTVPVPPDTFPRPDGLVPFSVRNSDGSLVPTQVEQVTQYPDGARGAAVVEILARVDVPPGVVPGGQVQYAIVEDPHPEGPTSIDPEVASLLKSPGSLILVANDAMGNRYRLDLTSPLHSPAQGSTIKILKKGEKEVQLRTHGVLTPVGNNLGAPNGALPHLFGVHAYITVREGEKVVSVDLRVHNGLSGLDKSDPSDDALSTIYFKSLNLYVKNGWRLLHDVDTPSQGAPSQAGSWTAYPLIAPNTDGTVHFMPQQGQLNRRLAVARIGHDALARSILDKQGLGFVRRTNVPGGAQAWSWWNDATANYWPQRHKLPRLDHIPVSTIDSKLNGEYWNVYGSLQSGNSGGFPIVSPALGWAHPYGIAYGGQTGGTEINLYDGMRTAEIGSRLGYRMTEMTSRMYADRMPFQLWNKSGEPVSVNDVLVNAGGVLHVPMNFFLRLIGTPDPFGFNQAPQYQIDFVNNSGLKPAYEPALAGYDPIDFQHYVRVLRNLKILAWLGNDALAKDDILHAAEIFRLSYHEYPKAPNGNYQSSGLLSALTFAGSFPDRGLPFGRGEAWGLDACVAAYALDSGLFRSRSYDWMGKIVDLVAQGQVPCSGFIQAKKVNGWLGGQWRTRSSPEQAIIENALWGLRSSVYLGQNPGRANQVAALVRNSAYSMIGPLAWAPQHQAPWFLVAVTPLDLAQVPYCTSLPSGGGGNGPDAFQTWSTFAYGYQLSGDAAFLQKAKDMTFAPNLLTWLEGEQLDNLWNWAALMASLQ